MAHIKITNGDKPGTMSVLVDGVEMNHHILNEGFGVVFPTEPGGEVHVTMKVAADSLELDLPQAVLDAVAVEVD